jgi:predicted butyrate kinase (DUF1464 family)
MSGAPRALGIDPGTVSVDVCGREGERLFLERTLPTAEVGRHPDVLIDMLRAAKEAAQGAALIGQGLTGGPLEELVEAMGLRAARGSALDHLYVNESDGVRRRYRQSEPGPAPFWERR